MLFVMVVMMILTALLVSYGRVGEHQIILFREATEVTNTLFRAKSLSISTFGETSPPCSYGVHFSPPSTFLIFKDLADDCRQADHVYSGQNELVESLNLDPVVIFDQDKLSLTDIVFIPPNPAVLITPDQYQATIGLKTADGKSSVSITVTKAGLISM